MSSRRYYSYREQNSFSAKFKKLFIWLLIMWTLFSFIHSIFFQTYRAGDEAMLPSIPENNLVFISPLFENPRFPLFNFELPKGNGPEYGDVVLLKDPAAGDTDPWMSILQQLTGFFTFNLVNIDENADAYVLRRVIGHPGDELYLSDYKYYIKKKDDSRFASENTLLSYDVLTPELSTDWPVNNAFSSAEAIITLGENEYFVAADNRNGYLDSRNFGIVHKSKLLGRMIYTSDLF